MLERVWRSACRCERLREVIVATDDLRIMEFCESIGALCTMTSVDHPTGSDRLAEVARGLSDDIVVNIQGDEPLLESFLIDAVVDALIEEPRAPMSTVVYPADELALDDPNSVKVVLDRRGFALYFSRSRIPAQHPSATRPSYWQHVGLYAYRRDFLLEFVSLERGRAERAEGLEQLRALEHGFSIRVAIVEGWQGAAVDVPGDIARAEELLKRRADEPCDATACREGE